MSSKKHQCSLCQKPADEGDYCYGCHATICDKCDKHNPVLPRPHTASDHAREWCADCNSFADECVCDIDSDDEE